jgi:ATP-dependent DNA helicase RecQ
MTSRTIRRALREQFGFGTFRPHQEEIVAATLAGSDVFAALPTGGGKSLCYQLPAILRDGLTVVVSPLIALMQDQVDGAVENGVRAVCLNSAIDPQVARDSWSRLVRGDVDLLYVSPERLAIPEFREHLRDWNVQAVAVDEAHCISEWGHEFRQDYRNLSVLRDDLPDVPWAAFTATATREVQSDVIRQLALRDPLVVRASFDRPEISYRVLPRSDEKAQIVSFVREHPGQSGIVYRSTRKAVEKTVEYLAEAGIAAAAYHAGLSAEVRSQRQRQFVNDEVPVIVATIAFGMGIDKADVRWILHGDLPRSLEAYYQETGRAGRDGEPADVLLLHAPRDLVTIRWHIGNMEKEAERRRAERNLREVLSYVESGVCRRKRLLAHFDEEHSGNCDSCDVCRGEVTLEDMTVAAQKFLSAVIRTGERFGAHHLVDVLLGERTDRVAQLGHDRLPTFGVGEDRPRGWWISLGRELETAGHIVREQLGDGGRLGGFRLTESGRRVLSGKGTVVSSSASPHPVSGKASGRRSRQRHAGTETDVHQEPLREDQQRLFDCLRAMRLHIARERSVPPYVVFSDRTLKVIARNRPTDRAGLLRCHGIGEAKLEQYGDRVLQCLREFLASGDCLYR